MHEQRIMSMGKRATLNNRNTQCYDSFNTGVHKAFQQICYCMKNRY